MRLLFRFIVLSGVILFLTSAPNTAQAKDNALWIWNTRQIIDQPEWRDSLLSVTSQLCINTLFLYLSYDISDDGDTVTLYNKDSLIALLSWAKQNSFKVHALAGEPEWALPQNHNRPLAFAREVIKLRNETGMPDGLQFDIEPYLLLPFSLPQTKQQLLKDWIHCVWKTGKLIREQSPLTYGIAIPFWMEDTITIENITMPIGKHLSFLTDYLAIMAYRSKAEGSASVISFSERELEWAKQANRKIYIGIETMRLGGSTTNYLCEVHPDTFAQKIGRSFGDYADFRFRRRKISVEMVDGKMLIGTGGSDISDQELSELRKGLMQSFDGTVITVTAKELAAEVRKSERLEGVTEIDLGEGAFALRVVTEELKQSTMFNLSKDEFYTEYMTLLKYAAQFPEIEGIAVHHLKSVRKFLLQ
ncbi:MAG: hypothetical protein ACOYNS_06810 [Bacteroidota bacterium]